MFALANCEHLIFFQNKFYKNTFLNNSKLNFTENLLSKNNDDKAITFISENGFREIKNWKELNVNVKKVSTFLRNLNIKSKDRVVAYMPNISETVEAFLGTVAIGSIWSSCSPDFGINGVIERFSQIKPKVLFVTNEYFYNGKRINVLERIPEIILNPELVHCYAKPNISLSFSLCLCLSVYQPE